MLEDTQGSCYRELAPPYERSPGHMGHPALLLLQFPQLDMGYQQHPTHLGERTSRQASTAARGWGLSLYQGQLVMGVIGVLWMQSGLHIPLLGPPKGTFFS